ncbi:MAG: SDR family oxidoreductase [Rhodospirillales bacterium]
MGNHSAQTSIITGAGSGIGRATAVELARTGVHVIAVGRRLAALEETAALAGGSVHCVKADVSTVEGRDAIRQALAGQPLNYLLHGAAISPAGLMTAADAAEAWQETLRINLDALFHLTLLLAPTLGNGGRVLFVGSNSATKPRRGGAAYCVSKAAGHMLYRCLKLELGEQGILMTSAIPSPVYTAIVRHHMDADPAIFPDGADYARQLASGRMIAAETVGAFYRWLLCDIPDDRFACEQWNIQDAAHHGEWLQGPLFIPASP